MAEEPEAGFNDAQETDETVRRGIDRRRSRRYLCEGFAEVTIQHPDTLLRGEIRNLSLEGCFVSTRARALVKPHADGGVLFSLRDRQYRLAAEVVNVRPESGIGIEFSFDDQRTQDSIRCLVEELDAIELRDAEAGRLVRRPGIWLRSYVGVRNSK